MLNGIASRLRPNGARPVLARGRPGAGFQGGPAGHSRSRTTRPHAARPSLSAIGGRGLSIVEQLCSSWGVRAGERGTTGWAVLPAPRASQGGGRGPGARQARNDYV
jgi:hypothetical protein